MNTIVVNIKGCKDDEGQIDSTKVKDIENRDIIYVGRTCKRGNNNWQLNSSIFRNPFSSNKYGLNECIRKYINHLYELLEDGENYTEFISMKGKTLACWCKPKLCHGDVLCYILNEYDGELIDKETVISNFVDIIIKIEEEEGRERLLNERIEESKKYPVSLENIVVERIMKGRSGMSYKVSELKEICRLLDISFENKDKKSDLCENLYEYDLVELINERINETI